MTPFELAFEDAQAALREAISRAPHGRRKERLDLQKRLTTEELIRERGASKA